MIIAGRVTGPMRSELVPDYGHRIAYTWIWQKKEKQRQHTWRALINETLDIEVLAKVRQCANTGLVLGTESFREQVHRLRN